MEEDRKKFRRYTADKVKAGSDIVVGTGAIVDFNLRHGNVWGELVYVDETPVVSGFTLDAETGTIVFDTAPIEGAEILVNYKYAAFTDTEIDELITEYGIDQAIVEGLTAIMADTARMRDYKEADTDVKNSQVFDHLAKMREQYVKDMQTNSRNAVISKRAPYGKEKTKYDPDLSRLR